ncbi:MAG TPA: glycosyltransferase [Pyrinomonadaceae bacterium]
MAKLPDNPLVSCIMPTSERRRFVPHAIRYFLRQDYKNKELIIVDDGDDPVQDLVPQDERVRYIRLLRKMKLGGKRNLACHEAKGELIVHWDDDDWYAPQRVSAQVKVMQEQDVDVCGSHDLLFYDIHKRLAWQYIYGGDRKPWLAGATLCYRKDLWERNRFAHINIGEDACFMLTEQPKRVAVMPENDLLVAIIHDHNTSHKETDGSYWNLGAVEEVEQLLGPDLSSYGVYPAPAVSIETSQPTRAKARNIYACLVHERQECVVDLVRNLRHYDPASEIILYNGSRNPNLLARTSFFESLGVVVYQSPKPMSWGWLHNFALDSLQFALDHYSFDTLTIVDSDQLLVRSNYPGLLKTTLQNDPATGMLGNSSEPQPRNTKVGPAIQAWREFELWRPFLERFDSGPTKFPHWTFWPSTVFSADAARDLLNLFRTDRKLQEIMARSNIWATEEVILPTLVSLLGYKINPNPSSYEFVRYKVDYSLSQVEQALNAPDVYWIHPVPRKYDHPIRKLIRENANFYERPQPMQRESGAIQTSTSGLLLVLPLLERVRRIEGWLDDEEADLLIGTTIKAVTELGSSNAIVEVGSYCGRSTVVIGTVASAYSPETKLYAIDPHDGNVGASDQSITSRGSTLGDFTRNISNAGLEKCVTTIQSVSYEVNWDQPISLLFIDGLHDYVNVSRDFLHFEKWVVKNGYVAFHDYADYYPGVKAFVDELLRSQNYQKVACVKSLMVLRKI